MLLHLYRVSLTERHEANLFEVDDQRFQLPTRLDYLFKWFGEKFSYEPRQGSYLRYIPTGIDNNVIAAVIARRIDEITHSDEDDPFKEVEGIKWETANLFLNVADDEQVIGIEANTKISSKTQVMVSKLVEAINEKSKPGGYKMDVFSVNESSDFWQSVSESPSAIISLTFDMVVPNPPDTTSPTKEALRKLKERLNANTVKETIANPEGLDLNNDFVKDREEYVSAGGGDVIAKSQDEIVFSSKDRVKKVEVADSLRASGEERAGLEESLSDKLTR